MHFFLDWLYMHLDLDLGYLKLLLETSDQINHNRYLKQGTLAVAGFLSILTTEKATTHISAHEKIHEQVSFGFPPQPHLGGVWIEPRYG